MLPIQRITPENFLPFGTVLDFQPDPPDPRFEVKVERPGGAGWRLAVFCVTIREAERLECHPSTPESFIPCGGTGVLLCAAPDTPDEVHAFLLDRPVCMAPGAWHEVVALSERAYFQVTEDIDVCSRFHNFEKPVGVSAQ